MTIKNPSRNDVRVDRHERLHKPKKDRLAEKHMRNALRNSFHESALTAEELDDLGFVGPTNFVDDLDPEDYECMDDDT